MSETGADWPMFLAALAEGIDAFAERVNALAGDGPAPVLEAPGRQASAPLEILIGVGQWATRTADGATARVEHAGICLQNKGAAAVTGCWFASVTDWVLAAEGDLWQSWVDNAQGAHEPGAVLARFTLVVEDVSPDSCFGLICFLARLYGVPAEAIPRAWVDYVRRWEDGDVRTTGEPFRSWGALHSALGHSFLGADKPAGEPPDGQRGASLARAWLACLRFDLAALRSGAPPHDLGDLVGCAEHAAATAFLHYEHQQYEKGLLLATRLQLSLPMRGARRRYKLVDAYFEEEPVALGAKKVFLRNDRTHPWLKDGFTLMGLFRAEEAGSGNDMTVSVDPMAGVHLEDLWHELERLEDERWGEARPCDTPRAGIAAYPGGRRTDGRNAPNEPWYDDKGHYTLLGAPRAVGPGGEPGTRLSWHDVLDAVWRQYNPLRGFKVRDERGQVCRVEALGEADGLAPGKRLVVAAWLKEPPDKSSLMFSPTVKRAFAACAARPAGTREELKLSELPEEASFDWLELPGGFAVVHREGVFLLDDWRNDALNLTELRGEFKCVSERLKTIEDVQNKLVRLVREVEDLVAGRNPAARGDVALLAEIASLKLGIQRVLAETLPRSGDPAALGFREAIERRWGVGRKLETFNETVAQIESTLRDHSTLRTNRIIGWLTIYGFPAVLLASFFSFSTADIPGEIKLGERVLSLSWGGIHWAGVLVYLVLVVLGVAGLRRWLRRRPPVRRD